MRCGVRVGREQQWSQFRESQDRAGYHHSTTIGPNCHDPDGSPHRREHRYGRMYVFSRAAGFLRSWPRYEAR